MAKDRQWGIEEKIKDILESLHGLRNAGHILGSGMLLS
jgi:hypothetical protein